MPKNWKKIPKATSAMPISRCPSSVDVSQQRLRILATSLSLTLRIAQPHVDRPLGLQIAVQVVFALGVSAGMDLGLTQDSPGSRFSLVLHASNIGHVRATILGTPVQSQACDERKKAGGQFVDDVTIQLHLCCSCSPGRPESCEAASSEHTPRHQLHHLLCMVTNKLPLVRAAMLSAMLSGTDDSELRAGGDLKRSLGSSGPSMPRAESCFLHSARSLMRMR